MTRPTLTLRAEKGSPLTFDELDDNFLFSRIWENIVETPTTLAGYGITDSLVLNIDQVLTTGNIAEDKTLIIQGVSEETSQTTSLNIDKYKILALEGGYSTKISPFGINLEFQEDQDITIDISSAGLDISKPSFSQSMITLGAGMAGGELSIYSNIGDKNIKVNHNSISFNTIDSDKKTVITSETPTQDNSLIFPNKSGTISLLSDLTSKVDMSKLSLGATIDTIPLRKSNGRIETGTAIDGADAVNLTQLQTVMNGVATVSGIEETINSKLATLDDSINAKIDALDDSVNTRITSTEQTINTRITSTEQTINTKIDTLDDSVNLKIDTLDDSINLKLDDKQDKIPGYGLSQVSYTQAEKTKLSTIVEHYAGRFVSLNDLNAVVGTVGGYAYVSIDNAPTVLYAWNGQTLVWESTILAASEESPESIKTKYESNADTNAYTDIEKAKLLGIANQATKNDTDANLKNRANHTGTQGLSTIENLTTIINAINNTNDNQTLAINSHIQNVANPHAVTKAQVGLGNVDNTSDINKPISTATQTALNLKANVSALPTKTSLGLNNVDNTSDANKPISTATQTALNLKADISSIPTKTSLGLNNVDNTSDANKPVSTAQAAAIALKQNNLVSGTNIKTLNGLSLLGSGNIVLSTNVLSTTVTNNVTTREFSNRFEYSCKIPFNITVVKNNYNSITSNCILPVGITIDGSDEHYISVRNNSRTIEIAVSDTASRAIYLGFHNNWSVDTTTTGSVFVKLVNYK